MPPLLSPELIRALSRLRLDAPVKTAGAHAGENRSQAPGSSVEFHDYREYEPGDDYRHIDWNIYSRLDRLFVKVFTEERNRRLVLLIDHSSSMRVGDPPKVEYARQVAAALGYVALRRGDHVRQAELSTRLSWRTPWLRGRHRLLPLFHTLARTEARGRTALASALRGLSSKDVHHAVAVLISDLLDPSWEEALAALSRLRATPVLVHLLAPEDWAPSSRGALELVDAETGDRLAVTLDEAAARAFIDTAQRWLLQVRERCAKLGIACYQLDTSYPLDALLLKAFREGGLLR